MTRRLLLSTVVALGLLGGCLGRSLPLPPPSVTSQSVEACPMTDCPAGGVVLSLTGTALPGATVIVEDTSPAQMSSTGELLAVVARAGDTGLWRATLGPIVDRSMGRRVRAPQAGDSVNVWQISVDGDVSSVRTLVIRP